MKRLVTALALAVAIVPMATGNATAATVSKSRAEKSAKAAVLRAHDLSGYIGGALTLDPDDVKAEKAFYHCTGVKAPTFVWRDPGTAFGNFDGNREIDSSADVARSAKAARAHFRAFSSHRAAACWKKVITHEVVSTGGAVDALRVTAIHMTGKFYADRTLIHLDSYQLNGIVGAVEFSLGASGFETKAPSLSKLESLARTLVKRVRAN